MAGDALSVKVNSKEKWKLSKQVIAASLTELWLISSKPLLYLISQYRSSREEGLFKSVIVMIELARFFDIIFTFLLHGVINHRLNS